MKGKKTEFDKATSEQYLKALPYLEKYHELLNVRNADEYDRKAILMKLQNVYYNLSLLNIDKAAELKVIEDALEKLSGE